MQLKVLIAINRTVVDLLTAAFYSKMISINPFLPGFSSSVRNRQIKRPNV